MSSLSSVHAQYLTGYGGHLESEVEAGLLPVGQNNPQQCAMNLYAEQLSGTPFVAPRHLNKRTWLYRRKPSVKHAPPQKIKPPSPFHVKPVDCVHEPRQLRWDPLVQSINNYRGTDFYSGLATIAAAGSADTRHGLCIYYYHFACGDVDMSTRKEGLCNNDGDFLIVPHKGIMTIRTELGLLRVGPCEIVVIPRGIRFDITSDQEGESLMGYVLELYTGHFEIPDLGIIGANGLCNPQDLQFPKASFIDERPGQNWKITFKYADEFYMFTQDHTPFDVMAWRGNYLPFKYDLRRFTTINTVSQDHPDPSIFTVFTSGACPGLADFAIFPPRWLVAEHTFRPPYFHRNCMSEFMGLIQGSYDAKTGGGFIPGGASLHNLMMPHGPDSDSTKRAQQRELQAEFVGPNSLAFMFESSQYLKISLWALKSCQGNYHECWQDL